MVRFFVHFPEGEQKREKHCSPFISFPITSLEGLFLHPLAWSQRCFKNKHLQQKRTEGSHNHRCTSAISNILCQTSEGSELKGPRTDSENKLSPDLHVNAGMRRRLISASRSSGGWGGMTVPSCMSFHESPGEIPPDHSRSTGSTGSGTATSDRTWVRSAPRGPINTFRLSFPSLPEAVGPSDQGKAETAKSNKHVAKEEDICSQYFSFWLAKKHFCQRRDRELKLGQTAGPKVPNKTCLDVISHFELP